MTRQHAEGITFTEASTTIRAGRCRIVGVDVHEDHGTPAVFQFCLADGSTSGTEKIWVNGAADTSNSIDYSFPREFPNGCYLLASPTGQFTGTVWVV
jgi:hypothetical protein